MVKHVDVGQILHAAYLCVSVARGNILVRNLEGRVPVGESASATTTAHSHEQYVRQAEA